MQNLKNENCKKFKRKKNCEKFMKFKQLLKISFGTKIQFFDNFQNIFWRKNSNPTILSKLYFWSKIRLLEKCKITKWVPKVLFVYTLKNFVYIAQQ